MVAIEAAMSLSSTLSALGSSEAGGPGSWFVTASAAVSRGEGATVFGEDMHGSATRT